MKKVLGLHIIIDLYGCDAEILDDKKLIKKVLIEIAKKNNLKILKTYFKKFKPHGVSGIVVIAESHLSIHTWYEDNYCAIDLFTCKTNGDYNKIIYDLKKIFKAERVVFKFVKRGEIIKKI